MGLLNVVFAAHSGLWGVLVIDMIQFFIKMTAVIAAAYFALQAPQVGGLSGLVDKLSAMQGPGGINYLNMLPDFTNNWDLAVAVFIMPIAVQWWAVWYPGAEPGGGSYIAQRMLASKSEKDALGAVLFFNVAHYVLRPWPWILTALCSILVYPQLSDIQKAFPNLDPSLLGHDIAFPAMLKFLPVGFVGLMVGGLIAANSSTILTHLNWGASYLVHDFYRRFIRKDATEKHYVLAGRLATVLLFVLLVRDRVPARHAPRTPSTSSCRSARAPGCSTSCAGSGGGSTPGARSWRWSARSCVSLALLVLAKNGVHFSTHVALILTIAVTTLCWVTTAYVGPQTDRRVLVEFYKKVRPFGPGWKPIRDEAGLGEDTARTAGDNIPLALLGWVAGCATIWSALFTVGNFLYGRTGTHSPASRCSRSRASCSCAWSAGSGRSRPWPDEACRSETSGFDAGPRTPARIV